MRISLLIDSPLTVLMHVMRGLDAAVRREIGVQTKAHAEPIWLEETRGRALSRLQSRLADSARVGVTAVNIFLRAGGVGKLSSGTGISTIAAPTELGGNPEKLIATRSRKGTAYQRKLGSAFGPPRRGGRVVLPAAKAVISRIGALWIQTTVRVAHEEVERI